LEAFENCSELAGVTIPGSVTNIGENAFYGDTGLKSVTISNGVASIGEGSFGSCSNLASVTIPGSVTNIGSGAFQDCASLTNIYFKGNAPAVSSVAFLADTNATVYYLPGTTGWVSFAYTAGVAAVLWNPLIQTGDGNFGFNSDQFGFDITGTAGIPIVVEASTNLASPNWTPLEALTLTNGLFYFSEPTQPGAGGRFYRIGSQ
jgi:hypothetical protein